jgi:hypothetical protein
VDQGPRIVDDVPEPNVLWLVTCARSGSTLLRYILDAHDEIVCPPEAGLGNLAETLARSWYIVCNDEAQQELDEPSPSVRNEIKRSVCAPMAYTCGRQGKRWYCDKSLDTLQHAASILDLFPTAPYVLLFRHAMDVVASALEASPWGFNSYGFEPFIRQSPHNFVAAIIQYWNGHVQRALEWEKLHGDLCLRMKYEDLVSTPERELTRLYEFLEVEVDLSTIERAFSKPRLHSCGPGDHKVIYTSMIQQDSVGRGRTVPIGMVPAPLIELTNTSLEALGYEPLADDWNASAASFGLRSGETEWPVTLATILDGVNYCASPTDFHNVAIVASDGAGLRWVMRERGVVRDDGTPAEATLVGSAETWVKLLNRKANAGSLFRSGLIRCSEAPAEWNVPEVLRTVVQMLQSGSANERTSDELLLAGEGVGHG